MLKTLTAALLVASMFVAPTLAADASTNPSPTAGQSTTKTPDAPAVKHVKTSHHVRHQRMAHHVKHPRTKPIVTSTGVKHVKHAAQPKTLDKSAAAKGSAAQSPSKPTSPPVAN